MSSVLPFDNQMFATLREWVGGASHIVVVSHRNSDGDAVGSSLGLTHVLRSLSKEVSLVLPNGCPSTFTWMPGADCIMDGEHGADECRKAFETADLVIGTDFNQTYRISTVQNMLEQAQCHKVLIDHHINPDHKAFDIVFSIPEMSSASELCYWIASTVWGSDAIGKDAATCFYTGIRTDTGNLSFSCSQPSVYTAVGELVGRGLDPDCINHHINDNYSLQRLQFYAFAITERLHVFPEQRVAYMVISLDDQHRFGVNTSEMEGLVNYVLKINDVEVGMLIREEKSRIKVSFRSKFDYNVERVAREYFGGGGHLKASGADCTDMTLDEVVSKIKSIFNLDK